jgi:hypothetical protein
LIRAQDAQATLGDVHDIDQADEVNAPLIEAEPPAASRVLAVTRQVLLAVVADDIVLAGNIEDLAGLGCFEQLIQRVEFLRFRKMRQVASVQYEIRRGGEGIDLGNGLLQGGNYIRVGRLVKTDVAVADLDEAEISRGGHGTVRGCRAERAEDSRAQHATADRPQHPGANPGHAFQEPAPVHAVLRGIVVEVFRFNQEVAYFFDLVRVVFHVR